MKPVLFVSNGHGEIAIAARIAREVGERSTIRCCHLALVGDAGHSDALHDVGPRRKMPSGGMVAMGNVANIARDIAAGLGPLTFAQWRFLARNRSEFCAAVAVGDAFALFMALRARIPVIFVGTAKSVYVAPYGRFEERLLRRAYAVFVRDDATVQRLQAHGIRAAAANVMADLGVAEKPERPGLDGDPLIALFPGSRESAYGNARFLLDVTLRVHALRPRVRAVLSVAPGLDPARFAAELRRNDARVMPLEDPLEPFSVCAGEVEIVRAWSGEIGAVIDRAALVLGQAGTANEAAAAAGVPVVAFEGGGWYRSRQAALLGGALRVLPLDAESGTRQIAALLDNAEERATMGRTGRERLGAPGAARRIAESIVVLCA
jgi:uncharacterized protein (TIGR03492 family)